LTVLVAGVVTLGLVLGVGRLVTLGRNMTDSQKGQAAAAMYAGQPFLLTVRAWLRIPDDRKRWRWRTGRLLITEISVSWRPTGRPGHPVILTGAGLVSRRQYDPRSMTRGCQG
jgi:hypothetical protein